MAQNNLFRHEGDVTRDDRQLLLGHKGATLWFTGLSGCGKVPFLLSLLALIRCQIFLLEHYLSLTRISSYFSRETMLST
jgi:hypothetical protein